MTDGGTSYHDLTGFRRDLLQAIAAVDEEPYGLALKAWLDERYESEISHSRLYQNLDHLADDGLVSREAIDERTNAYRLTDAGLALLRLQARDLSDVTGELPMVADGGQVADEQVPAVFQTYEDGAEFETDESGAITNHDELVDAGQTYREIRMLSRQTVETYDVTVLDEDHPLWCDEVADLEPGEVLRVDELRGEGDD